MRSSSAKASAELTKGRDAHRLTSPPDDWGGRAAAEWVKKLSAGERFGASTQGLLQTAALLDRLYESASDRANAHSWNVEARADFNNLIWPTFPKRPKDPLGDRFGLANLSSVDWSGQ